MPLNYKKTSTFLALCISIILLLPIKTIGFFIRFKRNNNGIKRILIQDGYCLGDTLMMSGILKTLKQLFRDAEIHFITSKQACEFLKNSNWVDVLIPFKAPWITKVSVVNSIRSFFAEAIHLRKYKYDMSIDFQGDPRGCAFLFLTGATIRYSLNDFGAAPFCTRTWYLPKTIVHQVTRNVYLLEKIAGHELRDSVLPDWPLQNAHSGKTSTYRDVKKRIIIHPGATVINRNWGSDKYAELINLCSNRHYQIDLIGGPGDEAKLQEITGMCKSEQPYTITTFEVLEEKIDLADCIVCNDSFMSHAAWAKKKAAVIIFGPANPHFFAPFSGPIRVAWNNLILTMPYELWTGPVPIASTDADTVMNAVEQLLAKEI